MGQLADNNFTKQVRTLIEILVGGGRKTDAESIQAQALALLGVPELKSAVSDADRQVRLNQMQSGSNKVADTLTATAALADPPMLQFLAWQDEWKTNKPFGAWHPDGSPVTNAKELAWLREVHPGGMDVGNLNLNPEPRFLHLWFSHAAFGQGIPVEVSLLDEAGSPIKVGAQGTAGSAQDPSDRNGHLGWFAKTLSSAEGTNLPSHFTVQLRYAAGPLERRQEVVVMPNTQVAMSLEGGGQLNGVGQNVDGQAFVALAVDANRLNDRRFGVVAVTKDGRELMTGGSWSGNSDGSGVRVEEFDFNVPLADVKKFIIGTRPIRTNEWENVVLPGN
jgi:hypothetical protein